MESTQSIPIEQANNKALKENNPPHSSNLSSVLGKVERDKDGKLRKGISLNPKGRPKNKDKVFSLRDDLLDSLKKLKTKSPKQYWELINSYWLDPKMRGFLMETIEGKATQRVEQIGSLNNPIRVIQVKELNIQATTMPQDERLIG